MVTNDRVLPISVLLPVRDGMPHLPEALQSLRQQSFQDFEVLVQDDGSRDDSLRTSKMVAIEDPRFRVASGPPQGIVRALNAAARRAHGRLLVRMDADDISETTRLERLWEFAEAFPEVGLFGSRIRHFPDEIVGLGMRHYEEWINSLLTHREIVLNRYVECPLAHPSWAMRRETFWKLEGYRDGPFPEDYEFFLRAADRGVRFGKLPQVLLHWREGPDRASRTDPRCSLDAFFGLKLHFLVPFLKTRRQPIAIVGAGPDGKRWATYLIEDGVDVKFFVEVHPRRIGETIHGAEVLGYDNLARASDCFFLGAVGQKGGRDEVRKFLTAAGFIEGETFLCVQ